MYKLKTLGICGNYYRLIHSFLSDKHQRAVLNGQSSKWSHIKAGVPQGLILGQLLFLSPYLYELIPALQRANGYPSCFLIFRCRTTFFQNSFLPFAITEWNKLDSDIINIDSHAMFRKKLLAFIRPLGNNTYGIYDPHGIRLLNRLHLGFGHLREHKFRHNLADTLNPLCSCSLETEDTEHYFLRFQNNLSFHTTLINDLNNINTATASLSSNYLLRVILYGDENFNKEANCKILTASIKFIKDTKRFEKSLF